LLQFLILPLITAVIPTDEYGFYDYLITISSIILPIVTLQTIDAVYRFMFDSNDSRRKEVVSSSLIIVSIGSCVLCIAYVVFIGIKGQNIYVSLMIILAIVNSYYAVFQRIARGLGENKIFAKSGIFFSFICLTMQWLLVKFTRLGIVALFISCIISTIIIIIYIAIKCNVGRYICKNGIKKGVIKEMIMFSVPLIPNAFSLWAINGINRILIVNILGPSFNGIYAIANKFPNVMSLALSVFQLAWQDNTILVNDDDNKDRYHSIILNAFFKYSFQMAAVLLIAIKIVYPFLIDSAYIDNVNYMPILVLASVFYGLALFYGAGYISSQKTVGAFYTTLLGATVSIAFSLILIRPLGLMGTSIGSCAGYVTMFVSRIIQMRDFFFARIEVFNIIVCCMIYCIATLVFLLDKPYLEVVITISLLFVLLFLDRKEIKKILSIMGKKNVRKA